MKRNAIIMVLFLALFASDVAAELIPIFEYSFPSSWNGFGTNIVDQSSASNDAAIVVAATLTNDVPPDGSGSSIDMGAFRADAYLILNADIATNLGLTIDLWLNPDSSDLSGGNTHNVFNHGRWDSLKFSNGRLDFGSGNVSAAVEHDATFVAGQWYHILIELDPTPYVYSGGSLTYDLTFTVDDVENVFSNLVKTTQGDYNNQPGDGLVFGKHPGLNYPFSGFLYDIRFSFGITPPPPEGMIVIIR